MSLNQRIATPEERRYIVALATIARRYDFITATLVAGQDRWKARLVDLAAPSPGSARSMATGTGDIALLTARAASARRPRHYPSND